MSNGKKKHSKNRFFTDYILKVILFVCIALVITVLLCLAIDKPVISLVHNIEAAQNMQVRDIVINNNPNTDEDAYYGDKIGVITCEKTGLNTNIYFGANRKSMYNGVGFSNKSAMFGDGKVSLITGYDETYLSSLCYIEKGDIINITAQSGEYQYKVFDMKYISFDKDAYKSDDEDMLVICSICSDLSEHSGECFYVFAQRIIGGGN